MFNGSIPPFALADGGIPLVLLRSLSVLGIFSAYGALVFLCVVAPGPLKRMAPDVRVVTERRISCLIRVSLTVAIMAMLGWLLLETAVMADAPSLRAVLSAIPAILVDTRFGHVIILQIAALGLTLAVFGGIGQSWRHRMAALGATAATILQVWHGHGSAMYEGISLLLVSDALHLLSAGAWLGGLLPLLIGVISAPPKVGAMMARSFSGIGKLCVAGVILSAAFQGWVLIGSIPALVGSAYGWAASIKLLLLVLLLIFAAANRYRFAPALLHDVDGDARKVLVRSLAIQISVGLFVVLAAGFLSSLPPGIHVQPVWPFANQPSLVTIEEDADFKKEVVEAILALAGALLLVVFGILFKRIRWLTIAAAILVAYFAMPHLDLLFIEAHPTSFYLSPTGFASATIAAGATLYPQHCSLCHGLEGRGDGPSAKTLAVPPADLTADHLWGHTDGELFWWLSHGIDAPEGGLAMPGFQQVLTEDQRWALIDYIRARNAGINRNSDGRWPIPVHAPTFDLVCEADRPVNLAALHGKAVRLSFGDRSRSAGSEPEIDGSQVTTISISRDASRGSRSPGCFASDPTIWSAYAIVTGIEPDTLMGVQILIDPNGWLRDVRRPGGGWSNPVGLLAEIEQICAHPFSIEEGIHAHHHHQ